MLAPNPDAKKGEDTGLNRELFLPVLALAVLTAAWGGFCWFLRSRVADPGVASGMTVMAIGSAVVAVGWLVAAWFLRPKR